MTARWRCGLGHWLAARRMMNVPVNGDEFDLRIFNPPAFGHPQDAAPGVVLRPNRLKIVRVDARVDGNPYYFALYADGACRDNGTPRARASVGVYGTPDAWYNLGLSTNVQTSQSAEIESALAALHVARAIIKWRWRRMRTNRRGYTVVLLVMDSSYVVRAMTEWIRTWRRNGFRGCSGRRIVNAEAFQDLDSEIRRLFEEHLVIVQFWHVPREYNVGADWLAAQALRGNLVGYNLDSDLDN